METVPLFPVFITYTPWLADLTGAHERLQPAKEARHFLEDVAFGALGPRRLAHHPGEKEHIPIQGEQGAAGAHGAVGIGPRGGAAHFVAHQVAVILQTLSQLVVRQVVKGERALESRYLLGILPAGDHGGELAFHQDAVSEVPFGQTGSDYIFLKDDAVAELDDSQVVFRTTLHVARVDVNYFHVQCLLSVLKVGVAFAWGIREGKW